MNCPSCGHEKREGASFCRGCGSQFSVSCSNCGNDLPAGTRFCDGCGTPVVGKTGVRPSAHTIPLANAPLDAPPTAQPTSFASGRYEVKKFLGEGGKKKVYLAYDTVLDRDVAFALIKTDALDGASRNRITREARAMGRLGDHPHIMPIYDLGQEHGQPFMVLPLMDGGDVEGLIKRATDHRLTLGLVTE